MTLETDPTPRRDAFCHDCGQPVDPSARFCHQCGVRQETLSSVEEQPLSGESVGSPVVAADAIETDEAEAGVAEPSIDHPDPEHTVIEVGFVPLVVGSGPDCDVKVDADGIAAMHFVLIRTAEGIDFRALHPDGVLMHGGIVARRGVLLEGESLRTTSLAWRAQGGTLVPDEDVPAGVAETQP